MDGIGGGPGEEQARRRFQVDGQCLGEVTHAEHATGEDPPPVEALASDEFADLPGPEQQRKTERDTRDRGRVGAIRSSDRF